MDTYEYVAVLTSIIIGLSITQLLYGLAQIVQHPDRVPIYWTHLIWVAYMFFTVVWWWWWQIALSSVDVWSLGLYLYVASFAVILYFICALLFPSDMGDYEGYRDYFLSRRRWFFGLLGTAYVLDFGDTLLKGTDYFVNLGMSYPLIMGVIIIGCAFAAYTRNEHFQGGFAVVAIGTQVYQAIAYTATIG